MRVGRRPYGHLRETRPSRGPPASDDLALGKREFEGGGIPGRLWSRAISRFALLKRDYSRPLAETDDDDDATDGFTLLKRDHAITGR